MPSEPVTRLPWTIFAEIGIQPPWQMKAEVQLISGPKFV
jgi:hypothetical protein